MTSEVGHQRAGHALFRLGQCIESWTYITFAAFVLHAEQDLLVPFQKHDARLLLFLPRCRFTQHQSPKAVFGLSLQDVNFSVHCFIAHSDFNGLQANQTTIC